MYEALAARSCAVGDDIASATVISCPSSNSTGMLPWVRHVTCCSTGCLKQSGFGLSPSVSASKAPEGGGDFTLGAHFLTTSYGLQPPDPDEVGEARRKPGQIIPAKKQTPLREDWALIDVGYGYSSFYQSATLVPANSAKTTFNRFRAVAAYNYFYGGKFIAGFAAGAERRNNLSSLTSVQFETVEVAAPPGTVNSIVKTQTGYYGNYKEYTATPIYVDLLYYPHGAKAPGFGNRLAVDFLCRADVASANRSALGGLGLFFFKKGNSTLPVGGMTATYDGTKVQVSLTTGFTVSK